MSPHDWNEINIVSMCDSMNYVWDAAHAEAYEKQISRRGVLFTLEQARRFVADTGNNRMHRYDWPPVSVNPQRIINGIKMSGRRRQQLGGVKEAAALPECSPTERLCAGEIGFPSGFMLPAGRGPTRSHRIEAGPPASRPSPRWAGPTPIQRLGFPQRDRR